MANLIYNPARGADFYTVQGAATASGACTGIKIVGGSMQKVATSAATNTNGISLGKAAGVSYYPGVFAGLQNATYRLNISGARLNYTMYSASGGFCFFTGVTSHGCTLNQYVVIGPSGTGAVSNGVRSKKDILYGTHKITALTSGAFQTNLVYDANYSGQQVELLTPNQLATFAVGPTAGKYIIPRLTSTLAGVTNTGYAAGNKVTRSIHFRVGLRTTKVTTALRAGYWNKYTGVWTTLPSLSSDIATVGTDHAGGTTFPTRAVPGEITYKDGGAPKPVNRTYSAKNT